MPRVISTEARSNRSIRSTAALRSKRSTPDFRQSLKVKIV